MRPKAILTLLASVEKQETYPDEILIIDGSTDDKTKAVFKKNTFKNLRYYKVDTLNRGLTKQRNFGVDKVSKHIDVVCFLDDDTVLTKKYFKELILTFKNKEITGVGGIALNENRWDRKDVTKYYHPKKYYQFEDYIIKEGLRNIARNYLGLQSNLYPGLMPNFSNGRTYGFPLNKKTYKVDLLIGMSFSFHRKVFSKNNFSTYFEGYGLYEDADYSIRAQKYGNNVINTKVQLYHYHNPDGRPNKYKYGKMVVRNGWYVWRTKYPNPSLKARFKWNAIVLLLMTIRFTNTFTTKNKKEAFTESLGRAIGWLSLLLSKPNI